MRKVRIHHFFDIIRDYGSKTALNKHDYGHSYHIVGGEIFQNKLKSIQLIIENDDICINCEKLIDGLCIDKIDHRSDYLLKQDFNNHIDSQIMNYMNYFDGQIIEIRDILQDAEKYLSNIFQIYEGNDLDHTANRKKNVSNGVTLLLDKFYK